MATKDGNVQPTQSDVSAKEDGRSTSSFVVKTQSPNDYRSCNLVPRAFREFGAVTVICVSCVPPNTYPQGYVFPPVRGTHNTEVLQPGLFNGGTLARVVYQSCFRLHNIQF